ncbi:Juvenile hormone esterase [Pseudolycoriella hygida]|uniref:Carboxylic ester hydrolase n=1 Tax=Pseudolycoriella hygida TaxID=35572 RepID=A0A9Q0MRK7_9DIPT|nr:Juvenile hormone esterase [Pseudolycoriella hygida]
MIPPLKRMTCNILVNMKTLLFRRTMTSKRLPQVTLTEGTVVGAEEKLPNGKLYYTYKGIPYAEPPIGKLRFEDPIPLAKFSESVLDCTVERDVPHHKDTISSTFVGSEDCLHLNVYSPTTAYHGTPVAVMVWIHGGAFVSGSGNSYYFSPEYLVQENVIVVTLNYRLGVLGFLSLPDAGISGNAGLKDQLMVFKWINKNISKFGGDANNVTIFGESAGAGAVGLHILKYFHKAICQSGSPLHEWLIQPDPIGKSKKVAERLGFKGGSQQETLEFLRNVSDLTDFQTHFFSILNDDEKRRGLPMSFKPCIERESPQALVTKSPIELMNQKNLLNIPVMIGYTSSEGIVTLIETCKKIDLYDKDLARMIPRSLNVPNESPSETEAQKVAELIRTFYFNGQPITDKLLNEMCRLQSDYHFVIGAHLYAEMHSRRQPNSPLYFYRFAYVGKLNLLKRLLILRLKVLETVRGACHCDEVFYLFNSKIMEIERLEKSVSTKVAKEMCELWTNFAKYGNPTPVNEQSTSSVKWDPVKPTKDGEKFVLDYLEIDAKSEMRTYPEKDRIEFWKNLYQKWNGGFLNAKL